MSKIIKLKREDIKDICKDFEKYLTSAKLSDGKISYTKSLSKENEKTTLGFTELAYLKMMMLVREFDKEIAWHGIVKRHEFEDGTSGFLVSDILVYPQEVTGTTVTTDQEKYQTWLMNHDDDVFNSIRMQGHSHVNMNVSPSGVDTSLYDRILEQLDDTMFYVFLIWNKKGDRTIIIYDLMMNILYETKDVKVVILDDGTGIEHFLKDAKEMVRDEKKLPVKKSSYDPEEYNTWRKKKGGKKKEKSKSRWDDYRYTGGGYYGGGYGYGDYY